MSNTTTDNTFWIRACRTSDVPENGGVCVRHEDEQIALFRFARTGAWYASQNQCPHRLQMALSRGITGSSKGEPKVACPFHKRTFSLKDGRCLDPGEEYRIRLYQVRVEGDEVYIGLPEKQLPEDT